MGLDLTKPPKPEPPIVMLGPEPIEPVVYLHIDKVKIEIFPTNCEPNDVWKAIHFLLSIESKL